MSLSEWEELRSNASVEGWLESSAQAVHGSIYSELLGPSAGRLVDVVIRSREVLL